MSTMLIKAKIEETILKMGKTDSLKGNLDYEQMNSYFSSEELTDHEKYGYVVIDNYNIAIIAIAQFIKELAEESTLIECLNDIKYNLINNLYRLRYAGNPLSMDPWDFSFIKINFFDCERNTDKIIDFINSEIEKLKENSFKYQKYLGKNWFKIGIEFANGKMDALKKKHASNYTHMAEELYKNNYKSYRPYISESYNDKSKSDKNILSNKNKVALIHEYCIDNRIEMTADFKNTFNSFKAN